MFMIGSNGFVEFDNNNLPALVGSEKQVAWATKIRTDHINYLADQFRNMWAKARETGKAQPEQIGMALEQWTKRNAAEIGETSAAKWIERR